MTQAIGDVLKDKPYAEPPEIRQIKAFVQEKIGITPKVAVASESLIITLPTAAAAGALRASLHHLQEEIKINKRVLIRIGGI